VNGHSVLHYIVQCTCVSESTPSVGFPLSPKQKTIIFKILVFHQIMTYCSFKRHLKMLHMDLTN